MLASVGVSGRTVNETALLVPPAVVMVMLCGPNGAVAAILKVAVIWVAVITTPVAVVPTATFRVALVKLVPVRVTGTAVPITPSAGVTPASVGVSGRTVNVTVPVVPPGVVTEIVCGPTGAVAATLKVAVIWLAFAATPVAVIPAPRFRVAPFMFVPVRVTGTVVPITPDGGAMLTSAGGCADAPSKNNPLTTALAPAVFVTRRVTWPERFKTRYWPEVKALIGVLDSTRPVAGSSTSILCALMLTVSQSRQYSAT